MNQPDLVSVHRDHETDGISVTLPSVMALARQPANHPVETNIHGANQSGASCQATLRLILAISASNGGLFASRATYERH